jgi:hypothetical protein
MNASAAASAVPLLPGERRFPPQLLVFLALSFLAHAATFFLFQVAYPPHVTIPLRTTQVALLSGDDPEQQELLQWIESEDPALIAASAHPVPARLLKMEYEPSYLKPRTPPRTMPNTVPMPERAPGPDMAALLRSVAPPRPSVKVSIQRAPTELILSGELRGRKLSSAVPAWKTASKAPLEETSVLLGVAPDGEVRFATLQKSSGDHQTDQDALAQLARLRFEPAAAGGNEIVWGFASVVWADDAYTPSPAQP